MKTSYAHCYKCGTICDSLAQYRDHFDKCTVFVDTVLYTPEVSLQRCPDRDNTPLHHEKGNVDKWVVDRWFTDPKKVAELHAAEDALHVGSKTKIHRGESNDLWNWFWGPVRTCSFCGGIHPADALRLIAEGWEIDPTGKSYKRYLNPPGTRNRHDAVMKSINGSGQASPSVWSPTPRVKIYFWHWSQEEIDEYNLLVCGTTTRPQSS